MSYEAWLSFASRATFKPSSNIAVAVREELGIDERARHKLFHNIKESPVWTHTGLGSAYIPGLPIGVSAGLATSASVGRCIAIKDAISGAVRSHLTLPEQAGFDGANGLLFQGKMLTPADIDLARNQLELDQQAQRGFDLALSLYIGRNGVTQAPKLPATGRASFYIAKGLHEAPYSSAKSALKVVRKIPESHSGKRMGMKSVRHQREHQASQDALARLRITVRLAKQGNEATLQTIRNLVERFHRGDASAERTLKMLAIADRANRELDHAEPKDLIESVITKLDMVLTLPKDLVRKGMSYVSSSSQ